MQLVWYHPVKLAHPALHALHACQPSDTELDAVMFHVLHPLHTQ